MGTDLSEWVAHPLGEQPEVEEWSTVADSFAGRVHIEWDTATPVTPLGNCRSSLSTSSRAACSTAGWRIARCCLPARTRRANATCYTLLLSVLAGHRRYAH